MAEGFADWEAVVAYALSLPGAELASFYGRPTPKVRGRAFVSIGHEPDSSYVLLCSRDEKAVLMEVAPDLFWETDHYRNYGAVLVRFGRGDREWIEQLIARAWWDRAGKPERAAFGPRP